MKKNQYFCKKLFNTESAENPTKSRRKITTIKMKKFLTLLVLVAVVAAFSSCGNPESDAKKLFEKQKECNRLEKKYRKHDTKKNRTAMRECNLKAKIMGLKFSKKYAEYRDENKYDDYNDELKDLWKEYEDDEDYSD